MIDEPFLVIYSMPRNHKKREDTFSLINLHELNRLRQDKEKIVNVTFCLYRAPSKKTGKKPLSWKNFSIFIRKTKMLAPLSRQLTPKHSIWHGKGSTSQSRVRKTPGTTTRITRSANTRKCMTVSTDGRNTFKTSTLGKSYSVSIGELRSQRR